MDDICELRGIRVPCRVGVDPEEIDCLQILSVDLRFPVDVRVVAAADDIAATIDYRAVADGVFRAHEGRRACLIETVAESIATWVLLHTPVAWVEVRVTKEVAKTAAKTAAIFIRREGNVR